MRNGIIAAVLVLLIVVAGIFVYRQMSGKVGTTALDKAVGQKMDFMNAATRDKVSMTLKEFQGLKVDPQTSYRIAPSGALITTITMCMSCSGQIPSAPIPAGLNQMKEDEAKMKYECPLCKKKAYPQDL
jgi:hypothetical protein